MRSLQGFTKNVNTVQVFFLFHSAGHERAGADHRLASSGGLCWQLVWKGEVSSGGEFMLNVH